jgi:AcrR family transcriptional regulator
LPKIVDHKERKNEIVRAAWIVISRDGIESLTTRRLAAQLGLTHGALARYFPSKGSVLSAAIEYAFGDLATRLADVRGALHGEAALRALLHEAFPFEEITQQEAAVAIPFFEYAAHDNELRDYWRTIIDAWSTWIDRALVEMIGDGTARPDLDRKRTITTIVTIITGIQVHARLVLDEHDTRTLQDLIDSVVASVR